MRRVRAVGLVVCLIVMSPTAAFADSIDDKAGSVTQAQIDHATTSIELPENPIDLSSSMSSIVQTSTAGDEHTTTLQSDVLFDFGSATIDDRAKATVEGAVKDVPRAASVSVDGYTDNVGDDASNQTLSERRAKAVADVIRAKRPDLKLTEKGHGEADPVASNGTASKDDPVGRAKNRRVEVTYGS